MYCVLVLMIVTIIIIAIVCYGLYDYVFYSPISRRRQISDIPIEVYDKYKDNLIFEINLMETSMYETVEIVADDGIKLHGRLYLYNSENPYIIFFHGYRACFQWDGYGIYRFCRENNINCLMIEQRAHGTSKTSTICFGIKERIDCLRWAQYLSDKIGKNHSIFLAGVLMGSATVMMASDLDLPNSIKGIIADCGYTSPEKIIYRTAYKMKLPVDFLMPFCKMVFWLVTKECLGKADALSSVSRAKVPFLFIHGMNDTFVPVEMGKQLYENCKSEKNILLMPNAAHAVSSMENYELYSSNIMGFINRYA